MKKITTILNNEDGYFLILATLMILVLLTILGVAASRTANTEITVAANEMVYQRNFYLAEGALMEAIDILSNSTDLADNPPPWLDTTAGALTETNAHTYWDTTAQNSTIDDSGNTRFVAGVEDIGAGSSLDVDKPTVRAIGVYGRCERNGVTMIKVGYIKVY
jgi:Tfp pilus assembly protein PilX